MGAEAARARPLTPEDLTVLTQRDQFLDQELLTYTNKYEGEVFKVYQAEYMAAVNAMASAVAASSEFNTLLEQSRLVLMGDLHFSKPSQLNTAAAIRQMAKDDAQLVVVLEWIDEQHDFYLQKYLAGEISETRLRAEIKFDSIRGYKWSSHREILRALKEVRAIAIAGDRFKGSSSLRRDNSDFLEGAHSLQARDAYLVEILQELRHKYPEAKILVPIGNFHLLGAQHLPDLMAQAGIAPDLLVINLASQHYWKALKELMDDEAVQVLKFRSNYSFPVYYQHAVSPIELKEADLLFYQLWEKTL